jgi:hypothetical protein
MSDSARYLAPLNFGMRRGMRLSESMTDTELRAAVTELHSTMQQVIVALTQFCGIGSRAPSQWEALAELPDTVLFNNLGRFYVSASETLAYGDIINLHLVSGTLRARKANATNNTKPADGFCNTPGGVTSGAMTEVILRLGVATRSGLTKGSRYYLSTTGGSVTTTAPTSSGNVEQYLGVALSSEKLLVLAGNWLQH